MECVFHNNTTSSRHEEDQRPCNMLGYCTSVDWPSLVLTLTGYARGRSSHHTKCGRRPYAFHSAQKPNNHCGKHWNWQYDLFLGTLQNNRISIASVKHLSDVLEWRDKEKICWPMEIVDYLVYLEEPMSIFSSCKWHFVILNRTIQWTKSV